MPERARKGTYRSGRAMKSASGPLSRKGNMLKTRGGTIITDELTDQLAREAERGYDLSKGKRVGRRSLAGGSGRSPRVSTRTTPELYKRALAQAAREGKSLSELTREALREYVGLRK